MSTTTIPYGSRSILLTESFAYICDRILLLSDYLTQEALMTEIDQIYKDFMNRSLDRDAPELPDTAPTFKTREVAYRNGTIKMGRKGAYVGLTCILRADYENDLEFAKAIDKVFVETQNAR